MRIWENVHSKSNHNTHITHFHTGDKVSSTGTVILPLPKALWAWECQSSGEFPITCLLQCVVPVQNGHGLPG